MSDVDDSSFARFPALLSRDGVQTYEQALPDRWSEYRPAEEIAGPSSLSSFVGVPVTLGQPGPSVGSVVGAEAEGETVWARMQFEIEPEAPSTAEMMQRMKELTTPAICAHRLMEIPRKDGEPRYLLVDQDDLRIPPLSFEIAKPDPTESIFGQRLGGLVMREPRQIIVTELPMPNAPSVEAMLLDGWVWTGFWFARDQDITTGAHRPGRYAGIIWDRRVYSGRYADRLPTNRKRKRERCKARRRRVLASEAHS